MKKILVISSVIALMSSCVVSKKKYDALNLKKSQLEVAKADCESSVDSLIQDTTSLGGELRKFRTITENLIVDTAKLNFQLDDLDSRHQKLMKNATADAKNLSRQLEKVGKLNFELAQKEKNLEKLQVQLDKDKEDIDELHNELTIREEKVKNLENTLIAQKERVEQIKNKIKTALNSFSSDELTVTEKDGKLYVSLAEQLLFKSGSYEVDEKGEKALEKIATALKGSTDLNIMVEGHTDDVPMHGNGPIADNWDLSVKRATSIVKIMVKQGLKPESVTASGRGEHSPKVAGKTADARSKNRRTEIIISPKLSALYELLNGK